MFTSETQEQVALWLAAYGATGLHITPDGLVSAVNEHGYTPITPQPFVIFDDDGVIEAPAPPPADDTRAADLLAADAIEEAAGRLRGALDEIEDKAEEVEARNAPSASRGHKKGS
jgi:hypothetical protein